MPNKVTAMDLLKVAEQIKNFPVENPFAHLPESRLKEAWSVIEKYHNSIVIANQPE